MSERWKIDELAELVRAALHAVGCDAQQSGRVRSVPDRRTIRYYTTLGMLDKPADMQGRTALYGRRHVLQLVAIKRLQALGLSLLEVQKSLAGADQRRLVRWAGLPEGFWETVPAPPEPEPPSPDELLTRSVPGEEKRESAVDRGAGRFWAVPPAAPPAKEQTSEDSPPLEESISPRAAVHLGIRPGVTLVVEGTDWRHVGELAPAELAPALEELLAALRRAGLLPTGASQTQRNEPDPKHPTEENKEPT